MRIGIGKIVASVLRGFRRILDFVFPQNCIACDGEIQEAKHFLCADCKADIGFIGQPYCFQCGVPADLSYAFPHEEFECGVCRKNPYQFDQARSLGFYDTVLRTTIHHFKYRRQMGCSRKWTVCWKNTLKRISIFARDSPLLLCHYILVK